MSENEVNYQSELRKARTPYEQYSSHLMVRCPFHADSTPSLRLELVNGKFKRGFYKCWGCGAVGGWNKLAHRLEIDAYETADDSSVTVVKRNKFYETAEELLVEQNIGYDDWPSEGEAWARWRGVPRSLLQALDVKMIFDRGEVRAFLPCMVNDVMVGGIKAHLTGENDAGDEKFLKYITTDGTWVSTHGLFPYDFIAPSVEDYVVIVEGPRDALKLIRNGIPALAILGANLGGAEKAALIVAIASTLTTVFILPDPDNGGDKMVERYRPHLKKLIKTIVVKLPRDQDIDPGNMSKVLIKKLKALIARRVEANTKVT